MHLSNFEVSAATTTVSPILERTEQSLMIVNAKVAGVARKILFENGAKVNFISPSFCRQNNLAFQSSEYSAQMANGLKQAFFELTDPFEVQVNFCTEKAHSAVSHLKLYDAVLEKQWLASHNAVIFSETEEVHFKQKDKQIVVFVRESSYSAFVCQFYDQRLSRILSSFLRASHTTK